jgi:hypothetical protein
MMVVYEYFGAEGKACGKCDRCLAEDHSEEILISRLKTLLNEPKTLSEIVILFNAKKTDIQIALRQLLISEQVEMKGEYFHLKTK